MLIHVIIWIMSIILMAYGGYLFLKKNNKCKSHQN